MLEMCNLPSIFSRAVEEAKLCLEQSGESGGWCREAVVLGESIVMARQGREHPAGPAPLINGLLQECNLQYLILASNTAGIRNINSILILK